MPSSLVPTCSSGTTPGLAADADDLTRQQLRAVAFELIARPGNDVLALFAPRRSRPAAPAADGAAGEQPTQGAQALLISARLPGRSGQPRGRLPPPPLVSPSPCASGRPRSRQLAARCCYRCCSNGSPGLVRLRTASRASRFHRPPVRARRGWMPPSASAAVSEGTPASCVRRQMLPPPRSGGIATMSGRFDDDHLPPRPARGPCRPDRRPRLDAPLGRWRPPRQDPARLPRPGSSGPARLVCGRVRTASTASFGPHLAPTAGSTTTDAWRMASHRRDLTRRHRPDDCRSSTPKTGRRTRQAAAATSELGSRADGWDADKSPLVGSRFGGAATALRLSGRGWGARATNWREGRQLQRGRPAPSARRDLWASPPAARRRGCVGSSGGASSATRPSSRRYRGIRAAGRSCGPARSSGRATAWLRGPAQARPRPRWQSSRPTSPAQLLD